VSNVVGWHDVPYLFHLINYTDSVSKLEGFDKG